MMPVESQNTDSKLKTYIQESKKHKKSIKNNLRHLIRQNLTSSVSNDKSLEYSISN
jgi:hypothetical protein